MLNNPKFDPNLKFKAMEKILEFCSVGNFATIPPDIWKCLKDLWGLTKFSELVEEAEKYHLNPSTKKLVMDMERISCASYTPVDADILLARVKTTGIKELQFSFRDIIFQIFDVGGQRSERKKWVHCFENVNALLFCASMSEYDQTLIEDNTTNRMKESLKLFSSVLNNPWFVNSSIILFLNKTDLLEEKIQHTPLSVCFPEYTGRI
ncbi:hypothetical protein HZS_7586 [Henneguya salminicola]|uniref:Guanine nucleotide-binding protein G(O) subunit alpha (Trinotate prediction) n=1 Tax=Henneguya salminicola TaxID=69463 RepID=A0A6G3MHV5_HENSL|nr:hypothetical protein HZS_7586 [Henneguya salminicola]